MAKIKITSSTYDDAAADVLHLIRHHLIDPTAGTDKLVMYAERRNLMTLLVSGVSEGKYSRPGYLGKDTAQTVIKPIPKGELTSSLSWKYGVMGRIQKASVIIGSYGNVTPGSAKTAGSFMLKMATNELKPGMNCVFYNQKQARVQGHGIPMAGYWVYKFQNNVAGETFSYTTWVAAQPGTKTLFASYTTYGEKSLRGYGQVFYPEKYINHMTTQRKGLSISGDANVEKIRWYEVDGVKGWDWEASAQIRAQLTLEDEFEKMWGQSNMKDANGNFLDYPIQTDEETGQPIWKGDGWFEQIKGSNDMEASGSDGRPVFSDFADMAKQILKGNDTGMGEMEIFARTGTDGYNHASAVIAAQYASTHQTMPKVGDRNTAGYMFNRLYVDGVWINFVRDPMMDDIERWPRTLSDGTSEMGMTYYFMDMTPSETGERNCEIRTRGDSKGNINRNFVYASKIGMTGEKSNPDEFVDAKEFQILKQDMLVVYNTKTQGVLTPAIV